MIEHPHHLSASQKAGYGRHSCKMPVYETYTAPVTAAAKAEAPDVIRVDSQYVHAEVVKEALQLLGDLDFAEANAEFMRATCAIATQRLFGGPRTY
jgi:hypothetical protein